MEHEESRQLLLRLMALADRMEQRDANVIGQLAQQADALQRSAQAVGSGGLQFARSALDVLRAQGQEAVQHGLGQAIEQCNQQLGETARLVRRTCAEVEASAAALRRQRNLWLWAAPLALIVGSVLAAGGSSYLVWRNMAQLEQADFGQDILQATRSGTLTRCGEALCARVGTMPERYGAKGEYVQLVE